MRSQVRPVEGNQASHQYTDVASHGVSGMSQEQLHAAPPLVPLLHAVDLESFSGLDGPGTSAEGNSTPRELTRSDAVFSENVSTANPHSPTEISRFSPVAIDQMGDGELIQMVIQITMPWFRAWVKYWLKQEASTWYCQCNENEGADQTSGSGSTAGRGEDRQQKRRSTDHGNGRSKKYRRYKGDDGGDEEDESDDEDGHGSSGLTSQDKVVAFACPFFKRSPEHYKPPRWTGCATKGWPDLNRLKEHIKRRHQTEAFQCGKCLADFRNTSSFERHQIESPICYGAGLLQLPVLTPEQKGKMTRKLRSISQKEEWERVYKILFPDQQTIPDPLRSELTNTSHDMIIETVSDVDSATKIVTTCVRTALPNITRKNEDLFLWELSQEVGHLLYSRWRNNVDVLRERASRVCQPQLPETNVTRPSYSCFEDEYLEVLHDQWPAHLDGQHCKNEESLACIADRDDVHSINPECLLLNSRGVEANDAEPMVFYPPNLQTPAVLKEKDDFERDFDAFIHQDAWA